MHSYFDDNENYILYVYYMCYMVNPNVHLCIGFAFEGNPPPHACGVTYTCVSVLSVSVPFYL